MLSRTCKKRSQDLSKFRIDDWTHLDFNLLGIVFGFLSEDSIARADQTCRAWNACTAVVPVLSFQIFCHLSSKFMLRKYEATAVEQISADGRAFSEGMNIFFYDRLRYMTNAINLKLTQLDDFNVKDLQSLRQLEHLEICFCPVSSLQYLPESLRNITLRGVQLTPAVCLGLKVLPRLHSLMICYATENLDLLNSSCVQELSLCDLQIYASDLRWLASNFPSLVMLRLICCRDIDSLNDLLPISRRLQELILNGTAVQNLSTLILTSLHTLRMVKCPITDDTFLNSAERFPCLTLLDVSYCSELSHISCTYIKDLPLKHLHMSMCPHMVSIVPLLELGGTLETLHLAGAPITDSELELIGSNMKLLQELSLRYCKKITNSGLASLSRVSELRVLDLSSTSISDLCFLQAICLQKLDLHRSLMCGSGLLNLHGSEHSLMNLDIDDCVSINAGDARAFTRVYPQTKVQFWISNCDDWNISNTAEVPEDPNISWGPPQE